MATLKLSKLLFSEGIPFGRAQRRAVEQNERIEWNGRS